MSITMPDYAVALADEIRNDPGVLAIIPASRVAYEIPGSASMPENRVVISLSGGRGTIDQGPYMHARVDIQTYGTTGYEAMRLARAVKDAIAPLGPSTRIHRYGVVIARVVLEVPFNPLRTPVTGYPFVLAIYGLTVLEEVVP